MDKTEDSDTDIADTKKANKIENLDISITDVKKMDKADKPGTCIVDREKTNKMDNLDIGIIAKDPWKPLII